MRVLLVGGGGREHALAWKLAAEDGVSSIVCAPGNPGMPGRSMPVDVGDPTAILGLAEREAIDFTIVGPELPLASGVADRFADVGRALFGPVAAAARLESSKGFAKEFMASHGIPTAAFRICRTEHDALAACEAFGYPVVVKVDGLAAGKGVTVAEDRAAAAAAVHDALISDRFGVAGRTLVIEECLVGPEVSLFVLCDGSRGLALPAAQDHKRVFDNDDGPNTGGMGAFAPSPLWSDELSARCEDEIVQPVLDGLRAEGTEYRGVLYVGLMLTAAGPRVIEFNVRFGDPEAQVVLPMIESDLAPILLSAAHGDLDRTTWQVTREPHVGVVIASGGYPGAHKTGVPIEGLGAAASTPEVIVFHSGTAIRDGVVVTNGGRVLTVVARGETFRSAIDRAYSAVRRVSFSGLHFRTDIGDKALTWDTRPRVHSDSGVR